MDSASTSPPQYYCQACGVGITEEQIESGAAVMRQAEAYCRRCFRKKFPRECSNHPGVAATRRCSICRRRLCENCVIELQGRQICARCKKRALGELSDGHPRPFPSKILSTFDRPTHVQSTVAVFVAGILGFMCCGLFGILAVTGYLRHRREVARGWGRRSILADIGLFLGIGWLIFFLAFFILSAVLG